MKTPFSLDGKTVLLTGSTGYLGQPMARAIVAAGARLILAGRSEEKLQTFISSIDAGDRGRCEGVIADFSTDAGIETLCRAVAARCDRLEGIVNNSSDGRVASLERITADDFRVSAQQDMIAPFGIVQGLLPQLRAAARAGGASVVNIGTMYATVSPYPEVYGNSGLNNPIQYGASKAGLLQMTRYLACHLGPEGIRVNSVSPGPFPNMAYPSAIPGFFETLAQRVPLKRVGQAIEAAPPVVFLLSDGASYINGANIPVDGGWTAW